MSDLQGNVSFNPFTGVSQTMERNSSDGAPLYNSFIMDDGVNTNDSDEKARKRKEAITKNKGSEKKRMAKLIHHIVYTLEELRFIMDKNIFPRDMTLRLFGCKEMLTEDQPGIRQFGIKQLNNDRQLPLAFMLLHKLNKKI